jgi:hypothetical protein
MKLSKRLKLGIAAGAALTFGAVNAAPSYAVHQTVTGLTTGNQLVQFAVGTPNTLINGTPTSITFPMSATDTDLIGIDYRPRGGNLFAQASGGTIYVLEPNTDIAGTVTATQVGTGTPFTGTPTAFGFDFNPQVDRIRTVNDEPSGTSDNNYRFNPNSGARVAIDGDLDYSMGDPNDAAVPNVVGAAYTNNFDGTTSTQLYDIDSDLNILALQTNPNGGALSTVGALGVDTTENVGFDIEQGTNVAYASLTPTGATGSSFYRVNLMTGAATLTNTTSGTSGQVGGGSVLLEGVSLIPIPVLRFANAATSVSENGGNATITVVREGPLNQTATVNFATSVGGGDTATSGSDFTSTMGTLTFAPGDASENITIPITDEGDDEANETFTVTLSGPSRSANLAASPMTTSVTIVDDEATPGTLEALVSVPFQTERKVANQGQLKYSYSCDQECTESSELQLKDGTVLDTNSSSLPDAGKSNQTFELDAADVQAIADRPGRRNVFLRIVSTFTDGDGNMQTITTNVRLDR